MTAATTFEPFHPFPVPERALGSAQAAADFAARTMAVADGLAVILAALEHDIIQEQTEETPRPMFNPQQSGNLHRMAVVLAEDLARCAERFGDRLRTTHRAPEHPVG